ncbi:hypothetical protein CC2G_006856 [Coprinopsis cinerea AmutBmut pab1-1]|nr:hypothetical protein CC2G_006856 [Coprinopsis cinerea AmutBmut pab1-1]
MELGEDMGSYEWETALKHLVKVFVKKRPGRAREAYLGRDLVFWIDALSWKECGYREEWKDWLDQLRSVNVRFELTLGPRPGDDVEFVIPFVWCTSLLVSLPPWNKAQYDRTAVFQSQR